MKNFAKLVEAREAGVRCLAVPAQTAAEPPFFFEMLALLFWTELATSVDVLAERGLVVERRVKPRPFACP